MAHKVHPKIYRVRETEDWESRWFNEKNFAKTLEEDFKVKEFLKRKLKEAGVEKIEIERFPNKINIMVSTSRPGLIIGRGGKGIEALRFELMKHLFKDKDFKKTELKIEIKEIRNPWTSANLVAQWMAQRLESRIPYRRVLKQALSKITSYKEVKGARVEVSGRLNGVTIARREWLQKGKLPRQTIRADIDYGFAQARCSYGVIGVKVWIYKGELFE
jgi:small subunit ribosomal protein S3